MSRIGQCFEKLKADGQTALVSYITAGDPVSWATVPMLHALVDAGADILELGVPFSDPMSDGSVIQKACERALNNNISIHNVLDMVCQFRKRDTTTPIILMGYANPLEVMGYQQFAEKAQQVGVDGVLTVDLPPEESEQFLSIMDKHKIDTIFLVAPTTTRRRMAYIAKHARGFIYYVSIKGVTGSAIVDVTAVNKKMQLLSQLTDLPLGVGFGIRDSQSAAAVSKIADAVIVGSALVSCIEEHAENPETLPKTVAALLAEMRHAINVSDMVGTQTACAKL